MEISKNKVFIVIPCYNELGSIRDTVLQLAERGYKNIVLVDDGSSQDIRSVLYGLDYIYIRHMVNLGQGAALQTGLQYSKLNGAEIVITFDADGQHDANNFPDLIDPLLKNEADMALGSRFLPESGGNVAVSRKITLHLARFINFFLSGILLTDAHNGLRALNRNAIDKIVITENRMAHASEILFEIKRHHLRFKEIPVHIIYTDYSKQKGQKGSDGIKILFDLILHKLFR
jgi:glycosyltransferase involved in cell wall biosynthesis